MTEKQSKQDKPDHPNDSAKLNLDQAVIIVNDAIRSEQERLEKIASTGEADPVMAEGYTITDRFCQLMVDPKEVAKVFLEYKYPIWNVLQMDSPDEMWKELGRIFGINEVCEVDL